MRFVRSIVAVLALILLSISVGVAQETCKRSLEQQAGFSLCTPEGWSVQAGEGGKLKTMFAPREGNFTANINIKIEETAVPLTNYAGAAIRLILANPLKATSVKLVSWTDFASTSGLGANKVVFEVEYKGFQLISIQYYFDSERKQKFLMTGTCLAKDRDTLERVFDGAAKSFRLE